MDFGFSEEQQAVAEAAAGVFSGHASSERVAAVEAGEPRFDRELWGELARANLLGLAVPAEYGGSGLGLVEVAVLLIEQGRRVAPVPLVSTVVAGALPLVAFGSADLRRRHLPGIVDGSTVVTAALNVSGDGDPAHASVSAERKGAGWILRGTAPMVRAATLADVVIVPARCDHGVALFLVDTSGAGCRVQRVQTTDRQEHGDVILDGYPAGPDDLLGDPDGGAALSWIATRYSVALCALQLGVCRQAVELAAAYVTERRQFGKPLASFQGVALRAADAHIDNEAMAATLWQAAWCIDAGRDEGQCTEAAAVAKWWASQGGHRVVHAAQHLHGGLGADITYPLHRYFLWGKHLELEMGAGAVQLARIGRELVA